MGDTSSSLPRPEAPQTVQGPTSLTSVYDKISAPATANFAAYLHPDLWENLFQYLVQPHRLALTCKTLFKENLLWWLTYKLKNEDRSYRYKWEVSTCSESEEMMSFWIPYWSQVYEKATNYYKQAQRIKPVYPYPSNPRDWDTTCLTKAQLAVRPIVGIFGKFPVLMVASSVGEGYQALLRKWGVKTIPMHEKCTKRGITTGQPDFMGSTGFPGWEQSAGWCEPENLEVCCFSYGGSDPGGRAWDRFADQRHTAATYKKMVGMVLVTEILQFDISQFYRYWLAKLPDLINDDHKDLPILILFEVNSRGRGYNGPNRQVLWCDGLFAQKRFFSTAQEDKVLKPLGFFKLDDYEEGLNWLYQTRINMISNKPYETQ